MRSIKDFAKKRGKLGRKARKRSSTVLKVFYKNWRRYCECSGFTVLGHISEPNRSWIERIICIVLHAITFFMLGFLVTGAYREYQGISVVTVIDATNYPSSNLEFPGISLCNVNRISRKAAIELANEISSSNVTNWKFDDILELTKYFGSLYESDGPTNVTAEKALHKILVQYYKGDYDVTSIMKKLTPTCTEALSSCHFEGILHNCSKIFEFRRTQNGYCCTFNYAREPDDIVTTDDPSAQEPPKPYYIERTGRWNGLSLIMEPFVNDYHYTILPIVGWKLMIFNCRQYPNSHSGSMSEILLSRATVTLVQMDAVSLYSEKRIRDMDVENRECIFEDEIMGLEKIYTQADCRMDCLADTVWENCECRPFFLMTRGDEDRAKRSCNLNDLECWRRNIDKFWKLLGEEQETKGNYDNGINSSRICEDCFRTCDNVEYSVQSHASKLDRGVYHTQLLKDIHIDNQSIVEIYFMNYGSLRGKQEVAYPWYELVGNIGSICGIFIGFSLVSIVEIVYFLFCVIRDLYNDEREPVEAETTTRTIQVVEIRREKTNE